MASQVDNLKAKTVQTEGDKTDKSQHSADHICTSADTNFADNIDELIALHGLHSNGRVVLSTGLFNRCIGALLNQNDASGFALLNTPVEDRCCIGSTAKNLRCKR
jgi:hypothetical protein